MESRPAIITLVAVPLCLVLLVPEPAIADCSEEELTAVFLVEGIYIYPGPSGGPEMFAGKPQIEVGNPDRHGRTSVDLSRDTESYWQVDTFNCANLDSNTSDNHAWWCGAQFTSCGPDDPPEGYGNNWWRQWLGWRSTVANPDEPVTVTVRARMNMDTEPVYDAVRLRCIRPDDVLDVWEFSGFAEGLIVDQTFTLQPDDYTDPFDAVHLRWCFSSDSNFSDEDCNWPSAGAVQIDLIEVFFAQGEGPVQIGHTETCEPGSDLQWSVEYDELRLDLLDVAPIGPVTNPSMAEMIEAIQSVQPDPSGYLHQAEAGPFHLFYSEPNDYGGCAIVDGRNGRVVFAGTVINLGFGSVTMPADSSHDWDFPPGIPANEPATVDILPNVNWFDQYGTPYEITNNVVEYLRDSDVLRSFGLCDSYDVVSYIYTPIGDPGVDPHTASQVIIVSGRCEQPWNDVITAASPLPENEWLVKVAPNPFNPRTTIHYAVPTSGNVDLSIYDIRGRQIVSLVGEDKAPGRYEVRWSGVDGRGQQVPTGTYFCRLVASGKSRTTKMVLVR